MTPPPEAESEELDALLSTPHLVDALASDRFKQFLDHVPVAILVGEVQDEGERIVYANRQAEEILGLATADVLGEAWETLDVRLQGAAGMGLAAAVLNDAEPVGAFNSVAEGDGPVRRIEFHASLIAGDDGEPRFRLVALVDVTARQESQKEALDARLRDKDVALQEIQHRVKNNLQMITALIRMEARRAGDAVGAAPFDRLAGRIEALGLLYQQLSDNKETETVDLGAFLSQIAGAVVKGHGTEGVRLSLEADVCPATINVAMPVGLLVNELLTNSLKHAFQARKDGVLTLRCVRQGEDECEVSVADDGIGMPPDAHWPQPGKLGALIVRSIKENAKATIEVASVPGEGVTTRVRFRLPDLS